MSERMLLEHLLEAYGFNVIVQLLIFICDAKAAEMAAFGDMAQAKGWAMKALVLESVQCRKL